MKKNLVSSLLGMLLLVCCTNARAQYAPPTFALHISSPTAMFYKIGAKVEYRIYSENALLLGFTQYYGYFPGSQASLEYRIYFPSTRVSTITENLIYARLGTGYAGYQSSSLFSSGPDLNKSPGTYYFGGGGVGKHLSFRAFFFEITAGLKFTYVSKPPALYNERLFYSIGPGSIPDVHVHFGLQF